MTVLTRSWISAQVGTQGRMVGHTGQLVGQVSLYQLLRPDPEELHLRPGRPQEDMEGGEEGVMVGSLCNKAHRIGAGSLYAGHRTLSLSNGVDNGM